MPNPGQASTAAKHTDKIRDLNDALRTTLVGGEITLTVGVAMLDSDVIREITVALQTYDDFTDDNDPYGEHDFGTMTVKGHEVIFKIDYYDTALKFHSPNAADPEVTIRVLTIMLADEY
jgi:hypothetical protein